MLFNATQTIKGTNPTCGGVVSDKTGGSLQCCEAPLLL